MALAWKAGWDKTLGSSNLPSSAVATVVSDPIVVEPVSPGAPVAEPWPAMDTVTIDVAPVPLADLLRDRPRCAGRADRRRPGADRGRAAGRRRRAGQRPRGLRADHRRRALPGRPGAGRGARRAAVHDRDDALRRLRPAAPDRGDARGHGGAAGGPDPRRLGREPRRRRVARRHAQRRRPSAAAAHVVRRSRRHRRDGADRPGRDRRRSRRVPGRGAQRRRGARPGRDPAPGPAGEGRAGPGLGQRGVGRAGRAGRGAGRAPWPTPPSWSRPCRWRRPAATPRSRCRWSPTASRSRGWWSRAGSCGPRWRAATSWSPARRRRCRTRCRSGWSRRCTAPSGTPPLSPRRRSRPSSTRRPTTRWCRRRTAPWSPTATSTRCCWPIAFDALRVAIAHVGQLSDRRLGHLWAAFFEAMSGGGPPLDGPAAGPAGHAPAVCRRRPPTRSCASSPRRSASTSASWTRAWRTTPPPLRSACGRPTRRSTCWPTSSRSSCCSPPTSSTCGRSSRPSARGRAALYGSARGAIAGLSDGSTDAVHAAVRAVLPRPDPRSRRT